MRKAKQLFGISIPLPLEFLNIINPKKELPWWLVLSLVLFILLLLYWKFGGEYKKE